MAKRGKAYLKKLESVDVEKLYTMDEAVALLKEMPKTKFDESVEVAIRLGVDTRKNDQNVRGTVALPNGTGKDVCVVVIADGEAAEAARAAEADHVGFEDIMEKIEGGWLDFDIVIATPSTMQKLRKLARILGPRGLMPNPKSGTLTEDTGAAVKSAKAGRVEFRADKFGITHVPVGRVSFEASALVENTDAVFQSILRAKPASTKGDYLLGCSISSTMSPGIKLDLKQIVRK